MGRPRKIQPLPNLDEQIAAVAQTIQARFGIVKGELDRLTEQYFRITGKHLARAVGKASAPGANAAPAADAGSAGPIAGKTKAGKKRLRKEGIKLEWLQQKLGEQPMTLQQLQGAAEKEGRSALSVMNVLRANKSKFKTQAGEKRPGVKGVPPNIYSLK